MSVRYDFHNIVEVGVKDSGSLYRIHRNGLEQRRLNAVESVLTAAEKDRGLKGDGDLADRLTAIEGTIPEDADICDMLLRSFADVVRGLQ